jgi:signal transduction histidine kinase
MHGATNAPEARDEAVRPNGAKSEFLSRLSHQLSAPIDAILGFAQLMEMESELDAERREGVGELLFDTQDALSA